jgi:hypothetical protein
MLLSVWLYRGIPGGRSHATGQTTSSEHPLQKVRLYMHILRVLNHSGYSTEEPSGTQLLDLPEDLLLLIIEELRSSQELGFCPTNEASSLKNMRL